MKKQGNGFTLVELLVVVTIIVVLLALLVPSMNKAVYQAALVQCAANQKAIVTGTVQYAMDHRRAYPVRNLPETKNVFAIQPHKLADPYEGNEGPGTYDLRPIIRTYIQINRQLNDPLVQAVDLEKYNVSGGPALDSHIWSSTFLWFGWRYNLAMNQPLRGMFKYGDRFQAPINANNNDLRSMNLLVSDMDNYGSGWDWSSHPDFKHLGNAVIQDGPFIGGAFNTQSTWRGQGQGRRDPLELNHGFDDGSVQRYRQVEYRPWASEQMDRIPLMHDGAAAAGQANVPRH